MMIFFFSIFLFIFNFLNGLEEESLDLKTKKAMDQYLYMDKSDWTDFGDMFNYDVKTATNFKQSAIFKPLSDSYLEDSCFKTIQQMENCQQELKDVMKQNKCDKLSIITMQRIGNKIRNKLHQLADYHLASSHYNLVIHLSSINFDNFITNDTSNNCSSIEKLEQFFEQIISSFYLTDPNQEWKKTFINYSLMLTVTLAILIYLWCFIKASDRTRVFIIFISFMMLCVTWEWFKLYKIEVAKMKSNLNYHSKCLSQNEKKWFFAMGHYLSEKFFFSNHDSDNCDKYYQALYIDPFLNVSPAMAFSEAVAHFFFQPLALLGHSFGLFFKNLFIHIPEFYFLPILIATVIVIIAPMKFFFDYKIFSNSDKLSCKKHHQKELLRLKYSTKMSNLLPLTRSLSSGNLVNSW